MDLHFLVLLFSYLTCCCCVSLVTCLNFYSGFCLWQTLDVLLQILVVFPKVDALQSKVMSFIHRMVEVLGGAVFPFAAMIGSRMLSIALCFWKAKTPKRRESIDLGIPYMELPGVVPDLQKW